jgi:hypothetical protein
MFEKENLQLEMRRSWIKKQKTDSLAVCRILGFTKIIS